MCGQGSRAMSVIWITEVPEFHLEADGGVRVVLTSGKEAIEIGLSRNHCRRAVQRVTKLLDRADLAQVKRLAEDHR